MELDFEYVLDRQVKRVPELAEGSSGISDKQDEPLESATLAAGWP